MMGQHGIKAVLFILPGYFCGLASAAMLSPGDIVVSSLGDFSEEGDGTIYKVDPVTGDRIIISGPGVGSGPGFEAFGIAVATHRDVYFSDGLSAIPSVYHVDVFTGNRQVIASPTVGTGPVFQLPLGVVVRDDGRLIVLDGISGTVVLVDPATLHRTTISGPGVGAGPNLSSPAGIALGGDGSILVTDLLGIGTGGGLTSALFRVDPLTGDREIVSADFVGSGPGPNLWVDVAVGDDGLVLVTNSEGFSQNHGVLSIDLSTGNREIVSATGTGVGPHFLQPLGVAVQGDGAILVSDIGGDDLFRIDPVTGDRTLMSGSGVGSGPDLQNLRMFDIVPVPEPSSMILFGSGILLMLVVRWQQCPRVGD